MSDPILLFLSVNFIALLVLGCCTTLLSAAVGGFLTAGLTGFGTLLCLPPLLGRLPESLLNIPVGPPGVSLHLALDSLSAYFLFLAYISETAVAAFLAVAGTSSGAAVRLTAFCAAGTSLALLAADGVTLTIGMAVTCGAMSLPGRRHRTPLLIPLLLLAAICLLTPAGFAPRFDTIRAAPISAERAAAAAALTLVAAIGLAWGGVAWGSLIPADPSVSRLARSPRGGSGWGRLATGGMQWGSINRSPVNQGSTIQGGSTPDDLTPAALAKSSATQDDSQPDGSPVRCWNRAALTAGAGVPAVTYLLVRIIADLSASAAQGWWGVGLLLTGGAIAVGQGWRSAAHPDLDGSVACLVRRQIGLAIIGVGLTLICRTEDLPEATSFALAATFLLALGGSVAGTSASLVATAIGTTAGTYRLSRLGGLVHPMPGMSAAFAAGLLALCALPPGLGFACLWLLFEAILSAPRTGGVLSQLPLALGAAAVALSAALATTASVRLAGIALLGRPRSPRGSGAQESNPRIRVIVWVLAGAALLVGVLPGLGLWLLAEPAIRAVAGIPPNPPAGFAVMSAGSSAYLPLPVLALTALMTGLVILARRWTGKEVKVVGPWADGMTSPAGLPFGEPAAQSTGDGFLPLSTGEGFPPPLTGNRPAPFRAMPRALTSAGTIYLVLGAFATLLVILAIAQ